MPSRYHWKDIDGMLTLAALAPRPERERFFRRLKQRYGISRTAIGHRVDLLGLVLNEHAGVRARLRFKRRLLLSLKGHKLYSEIHARLNDKLWRERQRQQTELHSPISLRDAAATLNISTYQLKRWIRWFGVLDPDEKGCVTPYQVLEFLLNDRFVWLLPAVKMPREQ